MLLAVLYAVFNGFSEKLAARLQNHAVLAAVLAGALLGLVGFFVPETMFSGETGLHALLGDWRSYTAGALLLDRRAQGAVVRPLHQSRLARREHLSHHLYGRSGRLCLRAGREPARR